MKQGRTITELAAELERQSKTKKDYLAPQGVMEATVVEHRASVGDGEHEEEERVRHEVAIAGVNGGPMLVNDYAHGQFASHLEIPKAYYDRMKDQAPKLLAQNVNEWLHRSPKERRMVRTLDGRVRAFLSQKYRDLDCYDLLGTSLPVLTAMKAQVVSSELTDKRLYIKAIFPQLSDTVPEGMFLGQGHNSLGKDTLVASVTISNSEVGAGSLRVEAGCFKTRCTNLMIFGESAIRKFHIGRSAYAELDAAVECFSDATRKADDAAFWMKVRDVVAASCNEEAFKAQVQKMREAAGDRIKSDDLGKVVEVTRKKLGIGENLQNAVLKHLIEGLDLSRWGLLNAVTRTAEDVKDYDLATDLERAGGKVLELPATDWRAISEAA